MLYSGPPEAESVEDVADAAISFRQRQADERHGVRERPGSPHSDHAQQLNHLEAAFPLGLFTTVTGVSGSEKSSLVSQALVELVSTRLGAVVAEEQIEDVLQRDPATPSGGEIAGGMDLIKRLVVVDQKPIGRTPRSNLATYTGLFDAVRKIFAGTKAARAKRFDAGRFSFNVAKGRCPVCKGEGFVMVELLFLPSVYAPCSACHGSRYNPETLKIAYRGKTIAHVLNLTVDDAREFFAGETAVRRALYVLAQVGDLGTCASVSPRRNFRAVKRSA